MSDERKRSVWPGVVGVVLTLVLYVLSMGPAIAVMIHHGADEPGWYLVVYYPLLRACERSEFVSESLWDYGRWCHHAMYPILWQ